MKCKNQQCIAEEELCNNELNCFDMSDEICNTENAISTKFKYGKFKLFIFLKKERKTKTSKKFLLSINRM